MWHVNLYLSVTASALYAGGGRLLCLVAGLVCFAFQVLQRCNQVMCCTWARWSAFISPSSLTLGCAPSSEEDVTACLRSPFLLLFYTHTHALPYTPTPLITDTDLLSFPCINKFGYFLEPRRSSRSGLQFQSRAVTSGGSSVSVNEVRGGCSVTSVHSCCWLRFVNERSVDRSGVVLTRVSFCLMKPLFDVSSYLWADYYYYSLKQWVQQPAAAMVSCRCFCPC